MNLEESFNFLINYILISPLLCYLIFGMQILFKRYSDSGSSIDQILEQEKLIKEFKTKYTKSSLHQNLQNRELLAQRIAGNPNISGRFIAFALKHEISNLNYLIYLLKYSHNLVKVPDIEGKNKLQIVDSECHVLFKAFILPLIVGGFTVLFIYLKSNYEFFSNIVFGIIFLLLSVVFLWNSFPRLAVYLFEKNVKIANYHHKKCHFKNICYLIECAMSKPGSLHMSVTQILKHLEKQQMAHDDRYHKDVWVLSTQGKAKHMASHVGKYSGQILKEIRATDVDLEKVHKYVIDALIINFSYSNIFTYRLSNHLDARYLQHSSLEELRDNIANDYFFRKGYDAKKPVEHGLDLAMDMCILASQILKTVESLDHVEDHPFRANFNKYTIEIFEVLITLCFIYDIKNIDTLIADRMYEVEERHEFFEDYGNYKDGYKVIK